MNTTFTQFIFSSPQHKRYLLIALGGTIIQFIIFKLLYPYADFFSDSYSYIFGAVAKLDINIWPIGYSWFLRLVHAITSSDTFLIGVQYFFMEFSVLIFFFTILYFYSPAKLTGDILFAFLFFNPLFLYICNYVNSDPLFAALSVLWITQLIWIIHRPSWWQIFPQAILLFLCFAVRNNAMYYPFITVLVFIAASEKLWVKIAGVTLSAVLILIFINYQRNAAYRITGKHQFSLFTGWQLANNALYMYKQIEVDETKLPSDDSRELDSISKVYFKQTPPEFQQGLFVYVANFFIRQPDAPLKQYFSLNYQPTDEYQIVETWGKASIVFEEYGSYLIRHYPGPFVRYYILTNVKNYFLPPLEKLEVYNLGMDQLFSPLAMEWFEYPGMEVRSTSKHMQGIILFFFPSLFMMMNLFLAYALVMFLIKKKFKEMPKLTNKVLLMISFFMAINFAFSVFATMNVMRYQFFPLIVGFAFSLLLIDWLKLLDIKEPANEESNNSVRDTTAITSGTPATA